MAKRSSRRRRARPAGRSDGAQATSTDRAARVAAKRQRQAEARREYARLRRRERRRRVVSRGALALVVVGAGALGFSFLVRAAGPRPIPEEAIRAATTAGCDEVQTPESGPSRAHLASGQGFTYTSQPATAGSHDPAPLPPDPAVYTSPVPQTNSVHNLEHGYVVMYYRPDEGDGGLRSPVVERLTSFAEGQDKVILAPHPELADGTAFALAAWNKLWECPGSITPQQATMIAGGFVEAYRGTGNAPEPNAA